VLRGWPATAGGEGNGRRPERAGAKIGGGRSRGKGPALFLRRPSSRSRSEGTHAEDIPPRRLPVQRLRGGPDATPCNWNGPDAETVLAYVLNHTAADRVEVTALTGTPQTPDEADRLLSDLERLPPSGQAPGSVTANKSSFASRE
jgi:hypothetical protein